MSKRDLAVVGFNGFIGSKIAFAARVQGRRVFGLTHKEVNRIVELPPNTDVVNAAGLNRGTRQEIFDSHLYTPIMVVNEIRKRSDLRLMYVSSERVYGWEKHPMVPPGVPDKDFGDWKVISEEYARTFLADRLFVVRPSNVYGHGARPRYNSVVATWMDLALDGKQLRVDAGVVVRDFICVKDFVGAVFGLLDNDRVGTWDIRSGEQIPIARVALAISKEVGVQVVDRNVIEVEVGGSDKRTTSLTESVPATSLASIFAANGWVPENVAPIELGVAQAFENETSMRKAQEMIDDPGIEYRKDDRGFLRELVGSDLSGAPIKRVYEVGISPGISRGGHFHREQTERFIVTKGKVVFTFARIDRGSFSKVLDVGDAVDIPIGITHWVWNPDPVFSASLLVASTHEFIPGQSPDTFQVNDPAI